MTSDALPLLPSAADKAAPADPPAGPAAAVQAPPAPSAMKCLAEGLADNAPADETQVVKLTAQFWCRLGLSLAIAVIATWWFIHYTDWYELIGSLLGLTGIFAWLGIVFKMVPSNRLERIQQLASEWLWDWPNTTRYLGVALLSALTISLFFGTLQLESVQGEYLVWINPAGTPAEKAGEADRVPANGRLRVVKLATWLAGDYQVRVSGFPEQSMAAKPWWRQDRQLPHSFQRPVVLIWPERSLIKQVIGDKGPARLFVEIDDQTYECECRGESTWVGYEGDMMVPKYVRDLWQPYQAEPALLGLLLQPRSLKDWPKATKSGDPIAGTPYRQATRPLPRELKPGQQIKSALYRHLSTREDAVTATYVVRSVQEATDMVQPVPLLLK
jgi:hypothetical protein